MAVGQTACGGHALESGDILRDPAGGDLEFGVAGVVSDEHAAAADELEVARLRVAGGHDPVFRGIGFVDAQELAEALVDDQQVVLDRRAAQRGGGEQGEGQDEWERGQGIHARTRAERRGQCDSGMDRDDAMAMLATR